MLAPEIDQAQPVMAERPQRAVGIAGVISFVIERRQVERRIGDLAGRGDTRRQVRPVHDLAAPAEPDAALPLQGLTQGHGKAARARQALAGRADAVRDDYEPRQNASSQLLLRRIAETINPTIEYVCGKLPHSSPLIGSTSSESRPNELR